MGKRRPVFRDGWRRHVAATPVGAIPIAYGNPPLLGYRVFVGSPAELLRAFAIASPDEEFWPSWLVKDASEIRKALARGRRKASAAAAAALNYPPPNAKRDGPRPALITTGTLGASLLEVQRRDDEQSGVELPPMNPNLCETCEHKRDPDGGWCYMFKNEPQKPCYHHTKGGVIGCVLKPRDVPGKSTTTERRKA